MSSKSILFPTDFSTTSLNALDIALEYAKRGGHAITIFHSHDGDVDERHLSDLLSADDVRQFQTQGGKFVAFDQLIADRGYDALDVSYEVVDGKFVPSIKAYVDQAHDALEMVVMGTSNDESRFLEFFFDSNTIKVLRSIDKPLLAVPEQYDFDGTIDNVAFMVDFREAELPVLERLLQQSKLFKSTVHILHFDLAHKGEGNTGMEALRHMLSDYDAVDIIYESIDSIDVEQSLSRYAKENNIDIVYLINNTRSGISRFITTNVSRELIKESDVPIMAIYHGDEDHE